MDRTVRREIGAMAHFEARDHREVLVCVPTFGHVTDSRLEELLIDGRYLMAPTGYKVASDQSHFAPSGRGAKWVRWVSRSVGSGKTMVEDRSLAMSCRAAK